MRAQRAFTLVELLVTLGIAAILASFALPGLADVVKNNRRAALVNEFVGALQLARSESAVRVRDVVICKSRNRLDCDDSLPWNEGWIVFVNDDRDNPARVDAGEAILTSHARIAAPAVISANQDEFVFRPFSLRATNGTATFCDGRGPAHARAVIVGPTGRPRLSSTRSDGSAIPCAG